MNQIIFLLSTFGLTFLVKEMDGPFGIIGYSRNLLMRIPYIGTFIYNLLQCPFCIGTWSGIIIYLLSQNYINCNILICWALASAGFNLLLFSIYNKITHHWL